MCSSDLRYAVALRETTRAAVRSASWVREHLVTLASAFVGAYEVGTGAIEEQLRNLDLGDPESMASLEAFADPDQLLGAMRSERQEPLLAELRRFVAVLEGYADLVVARIGGAVMATHARTDEALRRHRVDRGSAARFVDRLLGLFAMLVFGALMMLPNLNLLFHHRRLAALSWFTLMMLAACAVLVWIAFWGGVSRRWPVADQWLKKLPKAEHIRRSLDSCRTFGRHRAFLLNALLLSMILNAVCVLLVIALARGLGMDISSLALFAIVPIISCISALPLAPSGLGVRENLFVWMLAVPEINIPATQALSLSLLAFGMSLAWSLIGGAVYLGYKEAHHLREFAETPPDPN